MIALIVIKGRYPEAIEACNKAIEIHSDDSNVYINMGISLERVGRYSEAIEALDKAINLDPYNALAHYNKGIVLYAIGRKKEAKEYYKMAKRLAKNKKNS